MTLEFTSNPMMSDTREAINEVLFI